MTKLLRHEPPSADIGPTLRSKVAHDFNNAIESADADSEQTECEIFDLNGIRVANADSSLPAGSYLVCRGSNTYKIIIK